MPEFAVTVVDRDGHGFRFVKVHNVPQPEDAVAYVSKELGGTEIIDSVWLRVWP